MFAIGALAATAAFALVSDSGTLNVQVATDSSPCATATTNAGAVATYLSEDNACGDLGSSGTGVFESFSRVQASPNEQGFNTDAAHQLDNVDGKWTHSILVSDIPVISENGKLYWELYSDINEGNGNSFDQPHISLNDIDVWFTGNPGITAPYPFASGATLQYQYDGAILINDVNSGSGRADLRYLIPVANITIPTTCGFKDPACATYFVLYSRWGLTQNFQADPILDYPSDSGFEEWKVKTYPYVTVSKTANTTFTRTFPWTIDKSVTPATWNLFTGDTGTSDYTVTLIQGCRRRQQPGRERDHHHQQPGHARCQHHECLRRHLGCAYDGDSRLSVVVPAHVGCRGIDLVHVQHPATRQHEPDQHGDRHPLRGHGLHRHGCRDLRLADDDRQRHGSCHRHVRRWPTAPGFQQLRFHDVFADLRVRRR